MSLAAKERRDHRRRLLVAWNRPGAPASSSGAETRRLAAYAPEALPENQPALATLVPTSPVAFVLVAGGLLAAVAAAVGLDVWESMAGMPRTAPSTGRFAAALSAGRRCLDVGSCLSVGGWLAQGALVIATLTALVVRQTRRHRRDDYRGRYRAWGWLAGLFVLASCAGQVPLAQAAGPLVSEAVGMTLGPAGYGWWVVAAALLYGGVGLWAVLPLHERAVTSLWLLACYSTWTAAAACHWLGQGGASVHQEMLSGVGNACWMCGAALASIAMLAAARSVIREARGLPARTPAAAPDALAARARISPESAAEAGGADTADERGEGRAETTYVDGSEGAGGDEEESFGRHLSKAERKRLKKLARLGRAA